jgi:hypothetical protein
MRLLIRFIWGMLQITLGSFTVIHAMDEPVTFLRVLFIIAGIITLAKGYFKVDEI